MKRKTLASKFFILSLVTLTTASSLTACGASSETYTSSTKESYNSTSSATDDALVGFSPSMLESTVSETEDAVTEEDIVNETDKETVETTKNTDTTEQTESKDNTLYEDKLVYKCNLEVETLDFTTSYSKLQTLITKYSARIESEQFNDQGASYYSSDDYNYSGSKYTGGKEDVMVIRVPSAKYKEFTEETGASLGNIVEKTQTIENITQKYYDTTAQVKGLEAQLKRLEEMMTSTDDIEAMIKINEEITSVQSEINNLKTTVRTMDMDTTYSYVYMTLKEVVEYSEAYTAEKTNTFFDRLKNTCKDTWEGFLESCENLLFGLIKLIPTIAIIVIIVLIAKVFFWKKIKKRVNSNTTLSEAAELLSYKENTEAEETQKEKKDETK